MLRKGGVGARGERRGVAGIVGSEINIAVDIEDAERKQEKHGGW